MKKLLIGLVVVMLLFSASAYCESNYEVDQEGTHKSNGLDPNPPPPPDPDPECAADCRGVKAGCDADCWRGSILTMAGCLATCRIGYASCIKGCR